MLSTIFFIIAGILFVTGVIGGIKPELFKNRQGVALPKKQVISGFSLLVLIFLILGIAFAPPENNPTSGSVSAEDLPLWITVENTQMQSADSTLSADQKAELSRIKPLEIQDKWNEEMGYSEYLSPESYSPMTDYQVTALLADIQAFRKEHSDKWFDVMIFDDPDIAKTARTADYSKLPEKEYCAKFSHFRGAYSWNPTNQHEEMNIGINCDWQSLIQK